MGFFWGGSADFIFMGVGIFLIVKCKNGFTNTLFSLFFQGLLSRGWLDDRQITHLISVRLKHFLSDFLGGGGWILYIYM